jgi:hypothetical protein
MSCSPLLKGLTDPVAILRVVGEHHILRYSEPPTTFYPLAELGWVEYKGGHWAITSEGQTALEEEVPQPTSLADFFEL